MRILINRSDAIGDTILTTPMAKMLKEKFPNCHVTMLISSRSSNLLNHHPYIDSIKIYHRTNRFFYKIREVFLIFTECRPTHYFYVGGGYLPNFMAWLYRVPFRGGLKSRWHTFLFLNHGIRQKRSLVSMHEMEYNLNLLAPLGIKYHYSELSNYVPELSLTENEMSDALVRFNGILEQNNLNPQKKYIFIHPGMTGHTLNWSSKNYGRLVFKLEQKFPGQFNYIISHTPSDNVFLTGLKELLSRDEGKLFSQSVYYFNGAENGIRDYMAILSKASLFVGPSTGTTHIAAALGVPIVGIYSPIKVQSAKRWGPVPKNILKTKIVVPDVICGEPTKCALRDCPYYECMGKIEVDDIVKQAIKVMDL
jgi:ADP-heptose:LPS heptosyltransferase